MRPANTPQPIESWPEFREEVRFRMEKGRDAYGEPSFTRPPADLAQEVEEEFRRQFGKKVFRTVIRENVRLAEAPSFGEPITQYDPGSCRGLWRALAHEIIKQEKGTHG